MNAVPLSPHQQIDQARDRGAEDRHQPEQQP